MDYGYDYSSLGSDEGVALIVGIIILAALAISFVMWLITLYPRYYMVKTSGVGPAWSAFIPIWQDIQFFKMAGWKWWSYWVYLGGFTLLSMIPIVRVISPIAMCVFLCILYWKVSDNFCLGTAGKILSLFFGYWVYWYVALAKKPYRYAIPQTGYQNQDQNWYQQGNQQPQNQNWYQTQPQNPNQNQENQNWYQNQQ